MTPIDEKKLEAIIRDPEGWNRETTARLIAENGQKWVDEHKTQLDAEWEFIKFQFGL